MSTELPPPSRGEHPSADQHPPKPPRERRGARRRRPNYTVRRAVVGGGILAVVAAVIGATIYLVVRDDDDAGDVTAPSWNAVVEVDRASGDVRVLDRTGDEIDVIDGSGTGRSTAVHSHRERLAIESAEAITLVDTRQGSSTTVQLDRTMTSERLPIGRSLTFVVAPPGNGNLVFVDGATGDVLDVGDVAAQSSPLLFADSVRSDPSGRAFAVGDGRNFQTVVVRFGDDEAGFFPGVPMAVDTDLVVTSQNVGTSAELGLFTADGDRLTAVSTERPVGGIIARERFVYVTESGDVLAAGADSREPTELGSIPVPGGDQVVAVSPALDHQRLVVTGGRFVAVLDLDGEVVFQTTFTSTLTMLTPWSTWRCLPVGGDGEFHSLIDLDTGETLADLSDGSVSATSADGCAVHLNTDGGSRVLSHLGTATLGPDVRSVVLAPDATAALTIDTTGTARLIHVAPREANSDADVDGDGGDVGDVGGNVEPVELGTRRGLLAFVDR